MAKRVKISTNGIVTNTGSNFENSLGDYVKRSDIKNMVASSAIRDANTVYSAGTGISINKNVISVTGTNFAVATTSTSGLMSPAMFNKLNNIDEEANKYTLPIAASDTRGGIRIGNNLTLDGDILSAVNTTYTAGSNVSIDQNGKISALDSKYTAGENIIIDGDNKISAIIPAGSGGDGMVYTAGDNVTITGNRISAKDTTYTAGDNVTISGGKISAANTTYGVATTNAPGLMAASHVTKLSGIAEGANNYSLPIATKTTRGGIIVGSNLNINDNGVLSAVNTTYSAGSNISITNGVISAKDTTYPIANSTTSGLMSADMYKKLHGMSTSSPIGYSIPEATKTTLGGVIVGSNLTVATDGTINLATGNSKTAGAIKLYDTNDGQNSDGAVTQRALSAAFAAVKKSMGTATSASYAVSAGLAATATKLSARKINLTGAVTGSVSFDGTSNVNIETKIPGTVLSAASYGYVAGKTQATLPNDLATGIYHLNATFWNNMPLINMSTESRCILTVARTPNGNAIWTFYPGQKNQVYYAYQSNKTSVPGDWTPLAHRCEIIKTNDLNTLKTNGFYLVQKADEAVAWSNAPTGVTADSLFISNEGSTINFTMQTGVGRFSIIQRAYSNDAKTDVWIRKFYNNSKWSPWIKINEETISEATTSAAGLMSVDMVKKLNTIAASANAYTLPNATTSIKGGIIVGSGLGVSNGVLSANVKASYTLPAATTTTLGGIKVGNGLGITSGVLSVTTKAYTLPSATTTTLGGIIVGNNLSISKGVLSAVNTTYAQATNKVLGLTKLYTATGTNTDGPMTQNAITTQLNTHSGWITSISLTGAVTGSAKLASNKVSISTAAVAMPVTLPTTKPSNPTHGTLYVDMTNHAIMVYDSSKKNWLVTRNP